MNEIAIGYTPNQTDVTANVHQPDGTEREFDISTTEATQGGVYLGDCATIKDGDLIVAHHGSVYIGSERYDSKLLSEVNLALKTTIAARTVGVDNIFDLAAGSGNYLYHTVSIEDVSGGIIESRRITVQVAKRITVDREFSFPLAIDDIVKIYASSYSTLAEVAAAAQIADAVWDELLSGHKVSRSAGNKLRKLGILSR